MLGRKQVSNEDVEVAGGIREVWFSLSIDKRFAFIEDNIRISTSKGRMVGLVLTPAQRKWFLDGPLFSDFTKVQSINNRICLKCRNIGASLVLIACESVLSCWLYPNIFIPFVASREDQASDLIKHCKKVLSCCAFNIVLDRGLQYQSDFEIRFGNGSVIKSFPGNNPSGIRGPRSLVSYIDEAAFIKDQQGVISAIEYFHTEGGQMNLLSTPWGKLNLFWKIWSDRSLYRSWKRHCISLFVDMGSFDVNVPIPSQMASRNLKLSAPWLDIGFLEKKRLEDAPFKYANFLQETCGVPMDEVSSAVVEAVLDTNAMDYCWISESPVSRDANGKLVGIRPVFVVGCDFGATSNVTAAVVFHCANGRFVVCNTCVFRGSYPDQVRMLSDYVGRFSPSIFVGDATGMGGKNWMGTLHEVLSGDCAVVSLDYSKTNLGKELGIVSNTKNLMIETTIRLLSNGLIVVPKNHRELREEILGVEKLVFEKNIRYTGKTGVVGRDDLAMAFFQGAFMFDRIFSLDSSDPVVGAVANMGLLARDRLKHPVGIRKSVFCEFASASNHQSPSPKGSMSRLI